jgi:hypothetical protein
MATATTTTTHESLGAKLDRLMEDVKGVACRHPVAGAPAVLSSAPWAPTSCGPWRPRPSP